MKNTMNYPILVLVLSIVTLWLSALIGASFSKRQMSLQEEDRTEFGYVVAAALTLLGLIIGFTFSMALNRYDQRKNYEEAEANAIGTEFVRADFLPTSNAEKVRALLREYLAQRICFYVSRDDSQIQQIDAATTQLQTDMWSAILAPAASQPNPLMALAVSGMNDVLNSQGYTQAAWWNRIPVAAWILLITIAICCNALIGYGARHVTRQAALLFILPLIISISFFLIADIDSPRRGVIRVRPQNLETLTQSLHAH
jgi:hypothetical protein